MKMSPVRGGFVVSILDKHLCLCFNLYLQAFLFPLEKLQNHVNIGALAPHSGLKEPGFQVDSALYGGGSLNLAVIPRTGDTLLFGFL